MADNDDPVQSDTGAGVPLVTEAHNYPTVFADGLWFASNMANVVRLTFIENILEPQGAAAPGLRARHVGTLVLPRAGFKNMVAYLVEMDAYFDNLDKMAKDAAEEKSGGE